MMKKGITAVFITTRNGNVMHLPAASLTRLLQLSSPMLPVGAYSYSQGLEWTVAEKTVFDQDTAARWINDNLHCCVGRFEAPIWMRMYQAWMQPDWSQAAYWNDLFCAARETAEFRQETAQMGYSLAKLLADLGEFDEAKIASLRELDPISFPAAFSFAAAEWKIPPDAALQAYLWAWLENQVSATIKAVPLGQVAGQKILTLLASQLPAITETAMKLKDDELSNFAPALAIAGARHETQYSRLFRS